MNKIEFNILQKKLKNIITILDLGCGHNSILQHFSFSYSFGVDIYKPYIEKSNLKGIHSDYFVGDVMKLDFEKRSFDAIIAFDILEHLEKPEAIKLINNIERWASRIIILRTTNGFQHQNSFEGNVYQEHRSCFSISEFKEMGYCIYGTGFMKGFCRLSHIINPKPYELDSMQNYKTKVPAFLKEIGYYVVKNFPLLASSLICIKEK